MDAAVSTRELFRPGDNCCAVARADRVALVIDAQAYYEAFMRACERAEREILILAWDFDSRTGLVFGEDGRCLTTIGEFLNGLARRKRRLQIHILDWDYPMIFGKDREFLPLYGLSWKHHRRVHFRFDDTHPLAGSHHQKIVAIDDKLAFVGGLDLTSRRWD
jgi:phosphatidylserine/phosphatidylglycerophosphate/cardiolipin synthase-like enzyme